MCHRIARGVVPCVRLAASGSYCRADIRSRASVRPHTFALVPAATGAAASVLVHPSVESVSLHPIRYSHTRS
ncbi:hypothetical protein CFB50_29785 [Burkholderia sp. AU33423]|uniref:hypothetical protein n=1 Tax=Burkholderia sp. AU33423 TaxID=2015355 RepID=UPI000B7A63E1|nr:hypothetical protein [Burkholderia sp. AU33423]OXI82495.1 hypothetical protein CFB50_29785 [Burkholderia sp. AU33423]